MPWAWLPLPHQPGLATLWSVPTEVGWYRLSGEGFFVWEGIWIRVDQSETKSVSNLCCFYHQRHHYHHHPEQRCLPEYCRCSLTKAPHIKHHHMSEKLTNSENVNSRLPKSRWIQVYLEQEAQKGPQVFFPPWQQAGYPPKHSPIPSTRVANWMATTRRKTAIDVLVRFVFCIKEREGSGNNNCWVVLTLSLCLQNKSGRKERDLDCLNLLQNLINQFRIIQCSGSG